jgi:hypothetical protein
MYLGKIFAVIQFWSQLGSLLNLCDEYYGCLIGMSLLSSPSRSRPTHRKGRCSHDIIPHASAIASLLIVYASTRFPGVADVVPVTVLSLVKPMVEMDISLQKLRFLSAQTSLPFVHRQFTHLPSLIQHLLLVKLTLVLLFPQWTHSQTFWLCCPLQRSTMKAAQHRQHQ